MISRISKDGGWCWFQDPRIIQVDNKILAGFVSTRITIAGGPGEIRLSTLRKRRSVGFQKNEHVLDAPDEDSQIAKYANDHNAPALIELPSGKVMAFWSLHGQENCFYTQHIDPNQPELSGISKTVEVSESSRITYSNPIYLASESRLYNFFRGMDGSWKPSWVASDDEGETWSRGKILINYPGAKKRRPYVKYASNGDNQIHFLFTDDHPRSINNNIYHMVYRAGVGLLNSQGEYVSDLESGISSPSDTSLIWESSSSQTAWVMDAKLDSQGDPTIFFQVRDEDSKSSSSNFHGSISYKLAKFNSGKWEITDVAHAGPALYSKEEDYVGLGCINPIDTNHFVISSLVDPRSGKLMKYWTLFQGHISNSSGEISWSQVSNRRQDSIRPILLSQVDKKLRIFWLEGKYHSYTSYKLSVMTKILSVKRNS